MRVVYSDVFSQKLKIKFSQKLICFVRVPTNGKRTFRRVPATESGVFNFVKRVQARFKPSNRD